MTNRIKSKFLWDKTYRSNSQINHWPWSEVITLFNRYVPHKKKLKLLELGFGSGPNIPFFLKKKIKYFGIEASNEAVRYVKKKFPQLNNSLLCGDFTSEIPFKNKFDVVLDRGSITHNNEIQIINTFKTIKKRLNKNGYVICIDWFSKEDDAFTKLNTKVSSVTNIKKGNLKNVGITNFSDKKFIKKITEEWKLIYLDHKEKKILYPLKQEKRSVWSFILKK